MANLRDLATPVKITWCPGCGNFGIFNAIKRAIIQLGLEPEKIVAISGIGCHGKIINYIKVNGVHVIHGRVLPVATAIKLANKELTVMGFAGDGDAYNIGIGHLPHTIRRNPNIKLIIHNNMVYGLTTGQTSPTTQKGQKTKSTPRGTFEQGFNPLTLALACGSSFVARGYVGDINHLTELFKQAINFQGFAMVDVLQPCVAWNRINTYAFYNERIYKLEEVDHDPSNLKQAYQKALEWNNKIPIGVFYKVKRATYYENFPFLKGKPLVKRKIEEVKIRNLLKDFS